jgi:hypothetical protein
LKIEFEVIDEKFLGVKIFLEQGGAEDMHSIFDKLAFKELDAQAHIIFDLNTHLVPFKDIKMTNDEIFNKLGNFKLKFDFDTFKFTKLIQVLTSFYDSVYYYSYEMRNFIKNLNFLQIFVETNSEIKLSSALIAKYLKNQMEVDSSSYSNSSSSNEKESEISQMIGSLKEYIKNFPFLLKQEEESREGKMILAVLNKFKLLNLDHISGYALLPSQNVSINYEVDLSGLNDMIEDLII